MVQGREFVAPSKSLRLKNIAEAEKAKAAAAAEARVLSATAKTKGTPIAKGTVTLAPASKAIALARGIAQDKKDIALARGIAQAQQRAKDKEDDEQFEFFEKSREQGVANALKLVDAARMRYIKVAWPVTWPLLGHEKQLLISGCTTRNIYSPKHLGPPEVACKEQGV